MRKRDEMASQTSCLNKADDDEMLFVLRAKDPKAPATVLRWAAERVADGIDCAPGPKIVSALEDAKTMLIEGRQRRSEGIKGMFGDGAALDAILSRYKADEILLALDTSELCELLARK